MLSYVWASAVAAAAAPADDGSGSGTFDISVLAQYGVLGIFAILLIVFANTSYRREITRADRLEAEVLRLNQLIQEKHIPALEAAAHALRESSETMRDMHAAQRNGRN